ncbi:MAG: hypothetical protein ACYDH4_10905 [Candidatus Cryosericum sp.]
MNRKVVIAEIMSLVPCKYQKAKTILDLSRSATGTVKRMGNAQKRVGSEYVRVKSFMTQGEASKIVADAEKRIRLADEE